MADKGQLPVVTIPAELSTFEQAKEFIHKTISRRAFSKALGISGLGAVAFQYGCGGSPKGSTPRQVYVANALGLVVADNAMCVGCRRCEAACVEFNQGNIAPGNNPAGSASDTTASTMSRPSISNIKINRNLLYGVNGARDMTGGASASAGIYGNFTVVQNTCLQCPHPVPCQLACPHGAIQVVGPVNARVVNTDLCVGCGICVKACPWEMPALDGPVLGATTKSHKCHLCGGQPACVDACSAGALKYVPWVDQTAYTPERQVVPAAIQLAPDVVGSCNKCH
jgi:Fe-S-cluster-containing dehydrogenase component